MKYLILLIASLTFVSCNIKARIHKKIVSYADKSEQLNRMYKGLIVKENNVTGRIIDDLVVRFDDIESYERLKNEIVTYDYKVDSYLRKDWYFYDIHKLLYSISQLEKTDKCYLSNSERMYANNNMQNIIDEIETHFLVKYGYLTCQRIGRDSPRVKNLTKTKLLMLEESRSDYKEFIAKTGVHFNEKQLDYSFHRMIIPTDTTEEWNQWNKD